MNWKWIKKLTLFSIIVFLITFIGATTIGLLTSEIRNREKEEPSDVFSPSEIEITEPSDVILNDLPSDVFDPTQIPSEKPEIVPNSLDATFSIDTDENGGKPIITIKTNLPDKTRVIAIIKKDKLKLTCEGMIEGGQFVTEPFSQYNAPLRNGEYEVTAMMLNTQYPSVVEVIGEKNEALTGDIVKEKDGKKIAEKTVKVKLTQRKNPLMGLVAEYTQVPGSGEQYVRFRCNDKDAVLACNEKDWIEFIKLHREGLATYTMVNIEFPDNSQISFTTNMKNGEYKAVDEYGQLIKKFHNTLKYSVDQDKISLNVVIGNDVVFKNIKEKTYFDYNGSTTKKKKDLKDAAIEYIEENQTYMNHTKDEYIEYLIAEGCPREIAEKATKEYFG